MVVIDLFYMCKVNKSQGITQISINAHLAKV